MTYEEWKQKRLEGAGTAGSQANANYNYWLIQSGKVDVEAIGNEINNRVSTWLKNNENYVLNANDRFSVENPSYRNDASDWLSTVTTQNSSFKKEADNIKVLLDQYKGFFNADYIESVKQTLDGNLKVQGDVISNSTKDLEYWSQWKTEDDYKEYVAYQKDYEAKLNYDLEAGRKEIEELEGYVNSYQVDTGKKEGEEWWETLGRYLSGGTTDTSIPMAGVSSNISQTQSATNKAYKTASELLSKKKAYYTQAERVQKAYKLASVADVESENYDSEFESYAQKGLNYTNPSVSDAEKGKTLVNKATYAKEHGDMIGVGEVNGGGSDIVNFYHSFMTDEEIKIYSYYFGKGDYAKADEYLESLEESLQARHGTMMGEQLKGEPVLEYAFGVAAGLDQFTSGVKNMFSDDDYIPTNATQVASGIIREDLADTGATLPDWLGGSSLGQVGYDVVTTTSNMLPSILASVAANYVLPGSGAYVGATLMGASAGGNAKQEMLNLGYSKEQATAYGLMVAVAEGSMEYLLGGISKLGGKVTGNVVSKVLSKIDNAFARTAIKIGGSMASEALEEGLQTVIEPWLKEIATGVDWDDPTIDEVLYSSLLGALSAVGLEGSGTVAGEVNTYRQGSKIRNTNGGVGQLQALATNYFSADTVAYKIASKVDAFTDAYTIGRLLNEVGGTISEQNLTDIVNGLTAKGIRESDAKKIARQYQAILNAEMNMTDEQVKILENLSPLADVLRTNIIGQNTTVYQRTRAYADLMNLADEVSKGKKSKASKTVSAEKTSATEAAPMNIFEQNDINAELKKIASEVATGSRTSASENAVKKMVNSASDAAADKLGVEGRYTSSETGANRLKSNKQKVNIVGVDSITDGALKLKLNDGSIVDADEIDFSNSDEALVYEAVANMGVSANTAWEILKGYNPKSGQKGTIYAMGALEAYTYGHNGIKVDGMSKDGFSALLSPTQQNTANRLGDIDARAKVEAKQKTIDKAVKSVRDEAKSKHKAIEKRKGQTVFEGDRAKLTDLQESQLNVLEKVAEGLGVTFHIFESKVDAKGKRYYKMPNGKITSANGWYDPKTGEIWIDLYAGNDGQGTMIFTAAHELTHFIRQWSPAKFKIFADFLFEQYGKKGQDVNQLIREQMQKAANNGRSITWDEAYEEVIADSCETFLRDSKASEKIAALREKDISLANKIKTFLGQMLAKMRKLMADLGLKPETKEGQMVAEMTDSLQKLYDLWTDALGDAGKAYSTLANIDFDTDSVAPMLSERTWTASEYVTEREETAKKISKALGVDIKTAYKYIDDINSVARLIADDRARLDYEPNLDEHATVLKPNSDYKYSVDMSTLCAKRLLFTGTFDAIQRALPNTVFDSEDIVALREMMQKRGYEVACGICYVESTRREIGRITQEFIDRYKEAQKTGKPITRINSEGKAVDLKKTKDQMETTADKSADKFYAEKDYTPTLADLNTTDIDIVKRDHPLVYEAYLNFMNARGQAKPKLLETRAEYKGEILKHFKYKSAVNARNNAGGLRLQSFSDFEVPHLIDMMQIVMDMSRVGLKSQAYTKVPAFAEIFGDTGVKINLSLIAKGDGLDANGNLVFDDVEGINHNEAFKLRDKYSKNVGTILVGKTDAHIIAAMADSRIDYIIPFHKSSWKESLYDALGLTGYADYTDYQNEKPIDKSREIKNFDPSEYWDFSKSGDENAQIYLEKCREDGRIPKFPQFQGYPGYWKLLIDFKMYDNDGVGSPQEVVRPTFNTEASEKILSEYKGGHRNFPVAKDVVEDFVKEHKDNEVRYSFRDSKNGMANDALIPYNEEQTRFINQRGDYIIDSFEKLIEVVNLAFEQPDTKAIAHFGMVDAATLQKIKNSIPNLPESMDTLFADNKGYSIATTLDGIRHIVKEKQLSRQDVIDYLDRFADTIVEYDEVDFHYYTRRGRQMPGLLFRKDFPDGKYVSFDLVSQEKQSLLLQSLYIDSVDYEKRKSANPVLMQNAPASTSKTRGGQTSTNRIAQKPNSVNRDTEKNSLRNVEPIETADYVKMYHHFGSTKNYDVAGYILGNGIMLDFSGKHWGDDYSTSRQVDHRDIQETLGNRGSNNGVNAMIDMIGNGNIRLMPEVGGINLAVKPNSTQMSQLRGYINHFKGEVTIDIDEVGGDTIHSFSYTRGTSSAKVLADIKAYFDEGIVPEQKTEGETDIRQFLYSDRVADKKTVDFLNEQLEKGEYDAKTNPDGGYYVTYKSMSFWGYDEDGNAILRSPMAEYVDGKLSGAYLIPKDKNKHIWYQATETIDETTGLPSGLLVKVKAPGKKNPNKLTDQYLPASENKHLIKDDWSNLYFNLKKKIFKNGKWEDSDVPARYNPYEHSSNSMLNDQFAVAYLRDNLVTVKMYVPVSEDNGTYRATWSKDPTGWTDWKTGVVAGKIGQQKDLKRRLYLSRYATPVEIVPDSEVAQAYKGYLEGTDVAIPDNVVPPNLLKELKKIGVPIEESGKIVNDGTKFSDRDSEVEKLEEREYTVSEIKDIFNRWNSDKELASLAEKVFAKLDRFIQEQKDRGDRERHYMFQYAERPYSIRVTNADYIRKQSYVKRGIGVFSDKQGSGLYGITFDAEGLAALDNDQTRAQVLLHEAIHAITVRAIDKVKKEIPKDNPLYTDFVAPSNWSEEQKGALALLQIFQQVGFSGYFEKKVHYGEESVYEMVAELSNPEFRQFLKKKSLWSRVVDAIKRILGIGTENALDAASSALERILNDGVTTSDSDIHYSDRVLMGSLFSGGGTLEAGLVYQMLDKEFAVEYNKKIAATYTDNHGKEHMFVGDVRDFNSKEKQNVFYLHASPVCKNFSPASHSGGETTLDITTAQATARVLEEQMPQVFTVENVKRYIGSEAYNIITKKLDELGYTWDVAVYKASDYGNATKRERMIIRAVKDGQLPAKPQKASNITSWGEATRDLWETDLIPSTLVRSKIEAIKNTPQLKGVKLTKLDKPLLIYDTTKSKTVSFAWADELAPTLTTKCGDARIIMPDGRVYAPTPRFMGRIQGLPDDYKYPKATTNAFKIIGNGIPTQLTKAVMGGVLDFAYEQTHDGQVLFSDRSPSSVSTRSLLANALETTAQNDIERTKLEQYKSKIDLIEAEYEKLSEIKKQANDIRFTKGRTSAETKKMKALEFEANQIANRINTYDRQLLNLESTTALKNVLQREKELARRKEAKKGKEALAKQKERQAQTIRTLMDKNTESRKKAIDSRNRTEMRHKIRKVVDDLNNLLLNPTKDKHVPISLQKYVASALAVINMDTVGAEERIAKYNDLIAKAKDPDEIARLTKSRDNIELQGESLKDKLTTLQNAYAALLKSDDPLIKNAYDESIENLIENTIEKVGDTSLRNMSLEQLDAVYDMFKAIKATVRNANKMFKEGRQETITANSEWVKREISAVGGHHNRVLKATKFLKKFGWNMLKPIYAMKLIGSDIFTGLYENVRKGEDTWAVDVNEAKDFFRETAKKYNYKSWDFKKQYTFKDSAGHSFSLSIEQIMSLYAYSKREQADLHLENGGFIFDDSIEVVEKNKLGIPMKYEINDANPYRLKKDALENVISILDTDLKDVKGFVDEMQAYLSDVMGAKGNEVSLAMYDIKLYKEQNYFPLKTAKYFREFDPEKNGIPKIKNSGFSKNTVPQAGNPIILSNFMDVWANHVNEMSMYHAFVLPLEDFMRVYNYSSTAGGYDSVQQYIKNAYGSQANTYIETLMNDLNGGARTDPAIDFIGKGMSLFKKAAVFSSASVVIQQPSAIARALAYIDPKYFVDKPVPSKHSETWAEVKKYAPVAVIKEMGYFDTNMGRSTVDYITSQEYEGVKEKFKAVFADSNYRDEILSKAPALADELAWCAIWKAVKREIADSTNLQVGSEEFLNLAGKRFTEVVTKTQVYDSVLSRSALMRSKDTGAKMVTAFMAEPTTSLNMVVDALVEGKRGNKKFAGKAIGAVAASIILNSILVSLVSAARDDDDDETYIEKYLESLTTELIDGFNPLTYIPLIKDIWSIAQGYDVERADMSIWSDFFQSVENLFSDNKSGFEKVEGVVGAISSFFGLPLKNLMRDARAMYNLAETLLSGTPTTWAGVGDAVGGALKSSIPLYDRIEKWVGADESKSDKLYDAIISGDQNQIDRVKSQYKDDKAIESAIRQGLRENDSRIHEAAKARYEGDIEEYKRIAKEIIAEGNFSQDTVVAAINAEINAIEKGETSEEETADDTDKETSIYKASDINSAFESGDNDMALEVIDDLIKTKVANGMTEKEAKSSIRSSMTSYWKPLYKAAYKSGNTAEKERIERILKASGLYGNASEVIKTCREWRTERD